MKVVYESRSMQKRLNVKGTSSTGVASKKSMIRVVNLVALHHHLGVLTRGLGLLKGTRGEARNAHRSGFFKLMISIKPWIILLVPSSNETKPLSL
jgi:hypothetical protein